MSEKATDEDGEASGGEAAERSDEASGHSTSQGDERAGGSGETAGEATDETAADGEKGTLEESKEQLETASGKMAESGQKLIEGDGPTIGGTTFPTLTLVAIAAFVAIGTLSILLFWTLLGGFGFLVGGLVGVALGIYAVKLLGDRQGTA